MASDLFGECVDSIQLEYQRLGHTLGWRFLYSPRRTLANSQLMLLGLNPGGNRFSVPQPSVEGGNAFRVEAWPGNGSAHQDQVVRLLTEVGLRLAPGMSSAGFVDSVTTANFCPFRSPSLASLHRRRESLRFSQALWSRILTYSLPRVIVCNGAITAAMIVPVLVGLGFRIVDTEASRIGWGDTTYRAIRCGHEPDRVTVFALPHLSRYRFVGRDAAVTDRLCSSIAKEAAD